MQFIKPSLLSYALDEAQPKWGTEIESVLIFFAWIQADPLKSEFKWREMLEGDLRGDKVEEE